MARVPALLLALAAASCATSAEAPPRATEQVPGPPPREVRALLDQARAEPKFVPAARLLHEARVEAHLLGDGDLALEVETARRTFFEGRLPLEITRHVRVLMDHEAWERKVKDIPPAPPEQVERLARKGTYEGAKRYATRQVQEDLWKALVADVGASKEMEDLKAKKDRDPSRFLPEDEARLKVLTAMEKSLPQELKDFWEGRNKDSSTTTSYGYGSFIVLGTQLKLARRTQGISEPKDDAVAETVRWWDEASRMERTGWLLSWLAERGNFFEVVRTWDDPCESCGGKETEGEVCTACRGARFVHKVKWR